MSEPTSDTPDFSPEAIAEALREATPGPWHAITAAMDDWGAWVEVDDAYPDGSPRPLCDGINRAEDAHLIANAPTWLAQLLAALEASERENAELRGALVEIKEWGARSRIQYDGKVAGQMAERALAPSTPPDPREDA